MPYKYTVETQVQIGKPTWVIRVVDDKGEQLHFGTLFIEGSTKESLEKKIKQTCLEYEEILKEKAKQEAKRKSVENLVSDVSPFFQGVKEVSDNELAEYKAEVARTEPI